MESDTAGNSTGELHLGKPDSIQNSLCAIGRFLGILWVTTKIPPSYLSNTEEHIRNIQTMSISQLQPANQQDMRVYMPYFQGNKRNMLPLAISLYKKGALEGQRKIEQGDSIPFVATWNVSSLPADLTRCRMQFDGNADLSYEMMLASSEFVDFLIDVILNFQRARTTDFSKAFYRKLLRLDE